MSGRIVYARIHTLIHVDVFWAYAIRPYTSDC